MNDPASINYHYLTTHPFTLKEGDSSGFEAFALHLFALQYKYNTVYRQFCDSFSATPSRVKNLQQVPFLPIGIFKTQRVVSILHKNEDPTVFTSSGTSDSGISRHVVTDLAVYEKSFYTGFRHFYGEPSQYCILALLPSYLERNGSSLVYMAEKLIAASDHPSSNFYLHNLDELVATIQTLKEKKQRTLLLGVSYALLDLAEKGIALSDDFIVMETGGMKGKREEMLKSELHDVLKKKLGVKVVHSEYGMTELLSQAYSKGDGLYSTPPWMKILVRDTNDPFSYLAPGKTGGINVIDLANINSCAFIATQDLGKQHANGTFELMGRFDNSDIRGCNLLVE